MITTEPLVVTLVKLGESIPVPPAPAKRGRGGPSPTQTTRFSRRSSS